MYSHRTQKDSGITKTQLKPSGPRSLVSLSSSDSTVSKQLLLKYNIIFNAYDHYIQGGEDLIKSMIKQLLLFLDEFTMRQASETQNREALKIASLLGNEIIQVVESTLMVLLVEVQSTQTDNLILALVSQLCDQSNEGGACISNEVKGILELLERGTTPKSKFFELIN